MVEIVCMDSSSESWEPQAAPTQWHSRADGGAVHSITTGLTRRNNGLTSDRTSMTRGSCSGSTEAMETRLSEEMQHRLATIVMVLPSARYATLNI